MASPLFSIITPCNDVKWLQTAWESVQSQTEKDWEWVILLNNTADVIPGSWWKQDLRVKIFREDLAPRVGLLKKRACDRSTGQFIVELDHDDELSVDCLEELKAAFNTDPKPVFVFSDAASVVEDGSPYKYGEAYGWTYRSSTFRRHSGEEALLVPNHPSLLPQNVAQIYYAPNHVRAWRADTYRDVGGHDPDLTVCDDLDLMCKLYLKGRFHYVRKTLYKYRVHTDNTWKKNQSLITQKNDEIYYRYVESMALASSRSCGLEAIDIGGGIASPGGWTTVDVHSAHVITDLNEAWPFEDSSVGVIRAHDVIEHLKNPIHVMNEAYRVLCHGGLFLISVPSTDGRGAFQDPSHISFWNSNSFWYYTRAQTQAYIKHLGVNCRFQAVKVRNWFPSEWHKLHNIVYTVAHLAAIKEGSRLHGLIEI